MFAIDQSRLRVRPPTRLLESWVCPAAIDPRKEMRSAGEYLRIPDCTMLGLRTEARRTHGSSSGVADLAVV